MSIIIIISLIVTLVILGLIWWLVQHLPQMLPLPIAQIVQVLFILLAYTLLAIVLVLGIFGIIPGVSIPSVHL